MSASEADRFITRIQDDPEFLAGVEALGTNSDAVFEYVVSHGFDCTPAEIQAAFLETYSSQLTTEQLEAIAGGLDTNTALAIGIGGGGGAIVAGVAVASAAIAAGAV